MPQDEHPLWAQTMQQAQDNGLDYPAAIAADEIEHIMQQLASSDGYEDPNTLHLKYAAEAQVWDRLLPLEEDGAISLHELMWMVRFLRWMRDHPELSK